eukprot:153992_1
MIDMAASDREAIQSNIIWLQIASPTHLHLIPFIGQYSFYPHHAQPEYIMYVKWMNPQKLNQLPNPQHHAVGVGALVINSKKDTHELQWEYYDNSVGGNWGTGVQ